LGDSHGFWQLRSRICITASLLVRPAEHTEIRMPPVYARFGTDMLKKATDFFTLAIQK
jgi:hypothetical protein